jgi:hypothetical protein
VAVSPAQRTGRELVGLTSSVVGAVRGIPPWGLPQSVLGQLRMASPHRHSEYAMFASSDIGRSARYLLDVAVPSLNRRPPSWLPGPLRYVLFHETTIQRRPDPAGSYDSFDTERWFFINGILTDSGMAAWNADYLAELFHRPLAIIQNATDGPISDLIECADEKAFGMNGEPVDIAFPEIYRALKDPTRDRVVVIAHSQGTLIAAVLVRLLALVYSRRDESLSTRSQRDLLRELRHRGVTIDPDDFDDITDAELAKLEIYCFANCASEMRYADPDRQLPWIESFGNEHDLVARLGMLAPNLTREKIAIDGPRWLHRGAWGHLLNAHYLRHIDLAQGGAPVPGPVTASADPFERVDGGASAGSVPRLFAYLNGGKPDDRTTADLPAGPDPDQGG